ncbi:MAG: hypothetical protein COY80_03290 [Candidatus Pacebacteria bacterium CG_4_10_14_0_8_um_filter_42_14]|nr:MAG: hypothetical protein COY80_03290 [Candidatus Pacebacteria bacterium CG_4_10_14_0_8_um_filter_42_14]
MMKTKKTSIILTILLALGFGIFYLINSSMLFSEEQLVEKAAKEYSELRDQGKYNKIYDNFLVSKEKIKVSKSEYIKKRTSSSVKIISTEILSINISDDIAYLDTITRTCPKTNCSQPKELRAYYVWEKEDDEWKITSRLPLCIREKPYEMAPELSRALSINFEYYLDSYSKQSPASVDPQDVKDSDFTNCVFIEYTNSSDPKTQGRFFFDNSISSLEKLVIQVDSSYKQYDDLAISILLAHELQHALEFIEYSYDGSTLSCIESETRAVMSEWMFLASLSEYEKQGLSQRFPTTPDKLNQLPQPLKNVWDLIQLSQSASQKCGSHNTSCYWNEMDANVGKYVRDVYKDECKKY